MADDGHEQELQNPDRVTVPDYIVYVLPEIEAHRDRINALIRLLRGDVRRDWFIPHFYHCLPLVIGNQYGFCILLESDTYITWNGGDSTNGVTIRQPDRTPDCIQNVHSHFGFGIVTIDNPWVFRTAQGVNLMIAAPPNYPIDGMHWMQAVVETDNLRIDFTFNVKITRANTEIFLKAGTPIGYCIPIPRWFADRFDVCLHPAGAVLEGERSAMRDFHRLRHEVSGGKLTRNYRVGVDPYGQRFSDHQKK